MRYVLACAVAVLGLFGASATAHVVLATGEAEAGSYYAGAFRVGHGCGSSPTVALRVDMPDGVESARPQPKAGWTVEIERAGERVRALTWRGRLEADQYDEFGVLMHLPADGEGLTFRVTQTCESGAAEWAPELRLLRAGAGAEAPHAHHH